MKFVFLENRYKTYFWEEIARKLIGGGHSVSWLVQNRAFSPSIGDVLVLPYPRQTPMPDGVDRSSIDRIRQSDRNLNYFGGDDRHYGHYLALIWGFLDKARPDCVLGESTLFHELMAIEWCRLNDVRYLQPSMPGYPVGRFAIYSLDSKTPVGLSDDSIGPADCARIAAEIANRAIVPIYMRPINRAAGVRKHPVPQSLADRVRILAGYLKGERYNTPSPLKKLSLDRAVKKRLYRWNEAAVQKGLGSESDRVVLYPMQMQPEANLDVWGSKFRSQASLVGRLADALPTGWKLWVKLNPKTKYELDDPMLAAIGQHANVFPLPSISKMGELLPLVSLVCTVTGTVAVECVLSGKPVAQLGPGIVGHGEGCMAISDPSEIRDVIEMIANGRFPIADEEAKHSLVRRMYKTSFPGVVSDPASLPTVMDAKNVAMVTDAILKVVEQCAV